VLERQIARLLEEDVDDDSLRRSEDDVVDKLLLLYMAAVAADKLHPAPGRATLKTRVLAVLVR
jgi:hypothetical protein